MSPCLKIALTIKRDAPKQIPLPFFPLLTNPSKSSRAAVFQKLAKRRRRGKGLGQRLREDIISQIVSLNFQHYRDPRKTMETRNIR